MISCLDFVNRCFKERVRIHIICRPKWSHLFIYCGASFSEANVNNSMIITVSGYKITNARKRPFHFNCGLVDEHAYNIPNTHLCKENYFVFESPISQKYISGMLVDLTFKECFKQ